MKLYADPRTVNCRKVLAGLQHIGAPYTLERLDYFTAEHKSPEYMLINPNATMPALVDGPLKLWESNAILQYAADKCEAGLAYPRELAARADVNRWLFWEAASWFPSCYVYLVENCVKPLLGQHPDAEVLANEAPRWHKLAGILDARLAASTWLTGTHPSIADFAVAAPCHLHPYQKLPLDQYPNLYRWMVTGIEKLPAWEDTWVGPGFTLSRSELLADHPTSAQQDVSPRS